MKKSILSIAYITIARKELDRVFRIWKQTLLPPIITQSLYFVVFGAFLGERIGGVAGITYAGFLVPGLLMIAIVTNAFSNVASSFFAAKFQRSIEELLVAPVPPRVIVGGYVTGGFTRAIVVGVLVFLVSMIFVSPTFREPWAILYFGGMTAVLFSLFGMLNGLFARKFDDVSIIPTFVLTPLTYLGGVFYDINSLSPFWKTVSYLNPLAYAVDGFRYGFTGVANTSVVISALAIFMVSLAMLALLLVLIKRGIGLRN